MREERECVVVVVVVVVVSEWWESKGLRERRAKKQEMGVVRGESQKMKLNKLISKREWEGYEYEYGSKAEGIFKRELKR